MRSQISVSSSRKSSSSPFPFHLLIYESVFSSKKQTHIPSSISQCAPAGLGCWAGLLGCWENGRLISGCLHRLSPAGHPTLNSFWLFFFFFVRTSALNSFDSIQLESIRLRSIRSFLLFCIWRHLFFKFYLLLLRSILIILLAMSRSKSSVPCSCPVNTIERKKPLPAAAPYRSNLIAPSYIV